jgi:predicted O-methyltransferase YrrM
MNKQEVLHKLGLEDPFKNFTPTPGSKLWGWNGDREILPRMVELIRPALIIEVGSWMGLSSANLAHACMAVGLENTAVLCIDTWLGSKEHWREPDLRQHLELENGYPTFYRRFLSNMLNLGVKNKVLPLPMPSAIAASYLKDFGFRSQLIYIDGSHDEKDVHDDLVAYWELLSPGGVVFGDDWPWDSVARAVRTFTTEVGIPYEIDEINWIIRKP